ncbi:MAG: DUF190 domain-containing protein [Vallitaleaceae bacterium]|jgi:PII-like signaling protein|nr:DUF190 domain-containing protein [Vallitaleaceae bacterium]
MQVLIIILNEIEYLESVVKLLRETGIRGATVLDGLGSNSKNSQLSTPSFLASIVESLEQGGHVKKIIISLVERDEQVQSAMDKINELVNNENKKTSGAIMMTLPVNHMRGGELERHIIRRDSKKDNQGS